MGPPTWWDTMTQRSGAVLVCLALALGGLVRVWTSSVGPSEGSTGAQSETATKAPPQPGRDASPVLLQPESAGTEVPIGSRGAPPSAAVAEPRAGRSAQPPRIRLDGEWSQTDLQGGIGFRRALWGWRWMLGPLRGPTDYAREKEELDRIRTEQPEYWKSVKDTVEFAARQEVSYGKMLQLLREEAGTPPLSRDLFQVMALDHPTADKGVLVVAGREGSLPATPSASLRHLLSKRGYPVEELSEEAAEELENALASLEKSCEQARMRVLQTVLGSVRAGLGSKRSGSFVVRNGGLLQLSGSDAIESVRLELRQDLNRVKEELRWMFR